MCVYIYHIQNSWFGLVIQGYHVNKILSIYKCDSIMDFTHGENLDIMENDMDFILVPSDDLDEEELYWGPRIGLSAKFPEYHMRNYRYVAGKNYIKKQKTKLVKVYT